MPDVNLSINFPDEKWQPFLDALSPVNITIAPPGLFLYEILKTFPEGQPLRIVETGCMRDASPSSLISDGWSTFYFAKWVKNHPGSTLTSVELNPNSIQLCKDFLTTQNLSANFIQGESTESLSILEADVYFLDACDGFEHGLEEFKIALSHNPKAIIMDDWATKVVLAAEYAQRLGIKFHRVDRYTVFAIHA